MQNATLITRLAGTFVAVASLFIGSQAYAVAPTITVTLNNGATTTNTTDVSVGIGVTSGEPTEMYITNAGSCGSGGVWEPFNATKAWSVAAGDGTKRVRVRVRNAAMENSTCRNDTITLDTSPPTSPTISINSGNATTGSLDVMLTLSAAGTPTQMYITNVADCGSSGIWESYATSKPWTIQQANATNTVYVKYRDAAQNETACISDSIDHDGGAPTANSVSIADGNTYTNTRNITLTLDATAADEMYVTNTAGCTGGGTWEAYNTSKAWTLSTGQGTKTAYAKFRNLALEETVCISDTIIFDSQAPSSPSIAIDGDAGSTSSTSVELTLSAGGTPNEMYVTDTAGCASGGVWEPYTTSKSWTLPLQGATNTVYVRFRDAALNQSTCVNDSILHDDNAPIANSIAINSDGAYTQSQDVTLTLDATSASDMYVTNTAGCGGGGSWEAYNTSKAWTLTFGDGTKTVYVQFRNAALATSACINDTITLDTAAPTSPSISINAGAASTSSTTVDLTLSAAGTPSEMYITDTAGCSAGGTWEPYSASKSWTLPLTDATNTVYVKYRDGALNESTCASDDILHDSSVPLANLIAIAGGAAYTNNNMVSVTLDADLATEMYVTQNAGCGSGGTWEAYSTNKDWTFPTAQGVKTLYVQFRNAALETSACISDTITYDNIAPGAPTININAGSNYTNSSNVTLTLSANGSPAERYVTNTAGCGSGGSWEAYGTSKAWTLSTPNAVNTVYVKYRDIALNESSCVSDTITHDGVAPTVAVTSPAPNSYVTSGNMAAFPISGTCTESGFAVNITGAAAANPNCSGGTWSTALNLSSNGQGTLDFTVAQTDEPGNTGSVNFTLIKDTVAPASPTISINSGNAYSNSSSVNLDLSASGTPTEMYVTNTATCSAGGTWEAFSTSKAWTLGQSNSTATVYVKFRDAALNESSCVSDDIIHDSLPPTASTISINSDSAYTPILTVDVAMTAVDAIDMYVTQALDCASGGNWEAFSEDKEWTLATANSANSVYFKVRDIAGNESSCLGDSIDHENPPILTFASPASNLIAIEDLDDFVFGGTCWPNGQTVSIGGAVVSSSVCNSGSWSSTADLSGQPEGDVILTADMTNAHGLPASQQLRIFSVDLTAPEAPALGFLGTNDKFGVLYTNSTDTTLSLWAIGADEMYVTSVAGCGSGGAWEAYSATKAWTITDLNATNYAYAKFRDYSGNVTACVGASILHDNIPPPIFTVDIPASIGYVNGTNQFSWTFSGTCSDPTQKVVLSGDINLTIICNPDGTWSRSINLSGWAEGNYAVNFDHSDLHKNPAPQIARNMHKDITLPSMAFTSPNGVYLGLHNRTNILVEGTCSDNDQDIELYGAATGVATCSAGAWSASLDFSSTPEGPAYLYAKHRDLAGNYSLVSNRLFRIDSEFPTITATVPASGSTINGSSITAVPVSGTCSEPSSWVTIGGDASGQVVCMSGAWALNLDLSGIADGPVALTVSQADRAANTTTINHSFFKDADAPTGNSLVINGGALGSYSSAVSLTPSSTGASEMYITTDKTCRTLGVWEAYATSKPWTLANLNAVNWINVKFRDEALNETPCIQAYIYWDQTAPLWGFAPTHDPVLNSLNSSPLVTYIENANDALTGISKYQYAIGTGKTGSQAYDVRNWTDVSGGTFTATGLSLTNGVKYYINMRAVDGAGNNSVTMSSAGWTVEVTPPNLTITSHQQNEIVHDVDQRIAGGCESPNIISISYGSDVSGPANIMCIGNLYNFVVEIESAPGARSLTISQSDVNGNTTNLPFNFSYMPRMEVKGQVLAMAKAADGSLYFGGDFASYSSANFGRALRAEVDGSVDLAFDIKSGFNGRINAVAELADGSVIFGGDFTRFRGMIANRLAKIDANGALDLTFNNQVASAGLNSSVRAIVVNGSDIYIAGSFTLYSGAPANRVAKINSSGILDTTFSPAAGDNGANNTVRALALSGSDLYIGGDFTLYRNSTANRVAKLNASTGALNGGFGSAGTDKGVYALLFADNALYLGGLFTTYQGQPAKAIAKVDASGNLDTIFNPSSGPNGFSSVTPIVYALALAGTDIVAGGQFTEYRSAPANYVAKINSVGDLDPLFNPATGGNGFNAPVLALEVDGTDIYVGGQFNRYKFGSAERIAKLDFDGNINGIFNPSSGADSTGADGLVSALHMTSNGLYVGGNFTAYRSSYVAHNIVKTSASGVIDLTFSPQTGTNGFDGVVRAILIDGNDIYVGGEFTSYSGQLANRLARLGSDGSLDVTFNPSTGPNGVNGTVRALGLSGTDLFIGGDFTQYRESPANRIAKIDTLTGDLNLTFNPSTGYNGTNGGVHSLSLMGSNLYLGGAFTTYKGTSALRIAKVDVATGLLDTVFSPEVNGTNSLIYSVLAVGSNVYLGGAFTAYRGAPAIRLAKVDSNGNLDTTFSSGTGSNSIVNSLAYTGGYLYVAGDFSAYRSEVANKVAKVNGSSGALDTIFNPGTGFNGLGGVNPTTGLAPSGSLVFFDGSKIWIGGGFSQYRGKNFNYTVRVTPNGSL